MILDKKQMTEEDVKLQFITPAIVAKWTLARITMEKLKGIVSLENTGEFLGDKLPFGASKVSAKEK